MQDIIVIIGPTGIGKTKLSIELAKAIDAEIINGDSVAIYKGLDIGSAKPTKEEQSGITHHLIDIRNVTEDYSVYNYQQEARKKIEEEQRHAQEIHPLLQTPQKDALPRPSGLPADFCDRHGVPRGHQ